MRVNPDNAPAKQEAYRKKLEELSDAQLFREAKDKIWLSAYASNNPISCYHWQADATYEEAKRRGKPEIYDHGFRETYRGCFGTDPHPNHGPIPRYEDPPKQAAIGPYRAKGKAES